MKSFFLIIFLLLATNHFVAGQKLQAVHPDNTVRCATQQSIDEALRKNPSLIEKWRKEGERKLSVYLAKQEHLRGQGSKEEIITIPVVFHLIDDKEKQAWITDRDIYLQLELLNQGFNGVKADYYKKVIPKGMYDRLGRIKIQFVLARRTPEGKLTTGIQRRVNATPDRIKIKSHATGGLDAWDTETYLNIWAGTFSGNDNGLLGIATPPFYTNEGPQGVVVGIGTFPYTGNVSRNYYPTYGEGATLIHEIGHYFYLWHTFGDEYVCNNKDFRLVSGWPLPNGAGPEGDDTPPEKADGEENAHYGNPSQNYSDGCSQLPIGMMYGSFMNYFDDRAMFMFSEGQKKRVLGCIELYRPQLSNSPGATPPMPVTDAYLVSSTAWGTPERRALVSNNYPLQVKLRNYGNTVLNRITINVKADALPATAHNFTIHLLPGEDTVLFTQNISGVPGTHQLKIYTSNPNNKADDFKNNDTLTSFIFITGGTIKAPFVESFTQTTFPPEGWQVWNPNENITWARDAASGYEAAGSATVQNYNYNGTGQIDELITPAIITGVADSVLLTFKLAYKVPSITDVSQWDGLEIYVSNNQGADYQLAYKKTGNFLKSLAEANSNYFSAPPTKPEHWRTETVNLTPYLNNRSPLLIKFRNVTAYGNNLYLDDISVNPFISVNRDVLPVEIQNLPKIVCAAGIVPSLIFQTNGKQALKSLKINFMTDNGALSSIGWAGNLTGGQRDTIELKALPVLPSGAHEFAVFTSLPNGESDLNTVNDTIRNIFYVPGTKALPVSENFENSKFPPADWLLIPAGKSITWERTTAASANGNASLVIEHSKSTAKGTIDRFVSPIVTENTGYDSVFVSFNYAYSNAGSTAEIDTLEVFVSADCGRTLQSVWKKWGAELATTPSSSKPFHPGAGDWQGEKIYLTPYVGEGDFQVFILAKGNAGNNLFLDDIEIYGEKVPQRLKEQGYLIYPNPFRDAFIIRHFEEPQTLKYAVLYNSAGQKVWQEAFNGKAFKEIHVKVPALQKGVYSLQLVYNNKTVVEKIVKHD